MINIQEYKGYKLDIETISNNGIISNKRVIISKENKILMNYTTFARDIEKDYKHEIDILEESMQQLKEDKEDYINIIKGSLN